MAHEEAVSLELFRTVQNDVGRLNKAVYDGNGEPGLMSRMTAAEGSISTFKKLFWTAIAAMLSASALVFADVITRLLK